MRHLEILFVALALALCHLLAPLAFEATRRVRAHVASFSGGLAAAYVFLHLLPEIAEEGELLGPRIYFVVLLGLAAYYGLEVWIHRRFEERDRRGAVTALHLATSSLYNALLVFTLAHQLPGTVFLTVVFVVSMGLHLVSSDFGLLEHDAPGFARRGRYVLVAAVLAGYLLGLVREPHEEVVDTLTALLCGLVIYTVFHKELPESREARFRAFLSGMGVFLVAHVLLAAAE